MQAECLGTLQCHVYTGVLRRDALQKHLGDGDAKCCLQGTMMRRWPAGCSLRWQRLGQQACAPELLLQVLLPAL